MAASPLPRSTAGAASPTGPGFGGRRRAPAEIDTRSRILQASLLLFRQRGYHGVGISEILALAEAPRGCLYHHFPGGKDQIAVEVVELVAARVVDVLADPLATTTAMALREFGARLRKWMQRTAREQSDSACAVIASLAAEGESSTAVALAAKLAYERIAAVLASRLQGEGFPPPAARETAFLVIALVEGAGLVSQTIKDPRLFTAAIERAVALCELVPPREVSS